ncbi:MAG: GHKL domain-containing protein [Lactobacillaceae bacterium]|jgi:hypothetical protein|nr:GHKL domain-containing protein [Lactobacillaceae bacterium]
MIEDYISNLALLAVILGMLVYFLNRPSFQQKRSKTVFLGVFYLILDLIFLVVRDQNGIFQTSLNWISKHLRLDGSVIFQLLIIIFFIWGIVRPKKENWVEWLFWTSILTLSIYVAQFSGEIIFNEFIHVLQALHLVNPVVRTIFDIFFVIIAIWLLKLWFKPTFTNTAKDSQFVKLALIVMANFSTVILFYYMRDIYYPTILSFEKVWLFILIVVLLDIFVLVIYQGQNLHYLKINQIDHEKNVLQQQIETITLNQANFEKVAAMKHDLRNQNLVLLGLVDQGELEPVKLLLQEQVDQLDTKNIFFTHNALLNFLLNEKNKKAQQMGIELKNSVFVPAETKIPNDILAIVIGNLVDNALSAVSRNLQGSQVVELIVKMTEQKLLIEIKNEFDQEEIKTRQDRLKQGYGLKNIQNIVEKYGGLYQQNVNGNVYEVSIIFFAI